MLDIETELTWNLVPLHIRLPNSDMKLLPLEDRARMTSKKFPLISFFGVTRPLHHEIIIKTAGYFSEWLLHSLPLFCQVCIFTIRERFFLMFL